MGFIQKTSTAKFPQTSVGETRARIDFPALPESMAKDPNVVQWYEDLKLVLIRMWESPGEE